MSERDITPEDALQVAQRALQKANELESNYSDLKSEMTRVSLRLSEIDDERDYSDLTLDEKVGILRENAFDRAERHHGRAKLDYLNVMEGVFDGRPSADHCYKLMRLAAEAEGFEYHEPSGENKQLRVDATAAKRGVAFSSAKKDAAEGGW